MKRATVSLLKDREKPVRQQHPWVFSGAIGKVNGAENGDIVTLTDHRGAFLARGYYNARSQIQVRLLTWQDEVIDEAWWRARLRRALQARAYLLAQGHTGVRLVNAENDFLAGLVADLYGQFIVVQALTLGIDQRKRELARWLAETFNALYPQQPVLGVYERSVADVRGKEGLRDAAGVLWGDEPPEELWVREHGRAFCVDVRHGHKTGFYLDQRDNRQQLADLLLQFADRPFSVLNLFSYTGGFGVAALDAVRPHAQAAQCRIVHVDSSQEALRLAQRNSERSSADMPTPPQVAFVAADSFAFLRAAQQDGDAFDVIVCDPPKFAHNQGQVEKAARGYKDLNLNAFKLVKAGGYLMTFSCSGAVSRDLFQKIVFGALADSGRQGQIVRQLSAGDDHPIALTFPEGEYLKGLLVRVY